MSENVFEGDLYFNGVNGATGDYGLEPMPSEKLARLIQGKPESEDFKDEQQQERFEAERYFEELAGDPQKLLAGLTDEQNELLARLTDEQNEFLAELIYEQKKKRLEELIYEQQQLFEELTNAQQQRLGELTDEQQQLFEELIDGRKKRLVAELTDEQKKVLEELINERKRLLEVKGRLEEEKEHLGELKDKRRRQGPMTGWPVKEGVDPTRLDQAGWAVIFSAKSKQREAIKEALSELLELRQGQAGDLYRIYEKGDGHRPGETKAKFFKRHKIGDGPADPKQMPFYVLLVGSPEEIPYKFQYQLDVMRGVGRIDFGDDLDAYRRYARSVVLAETGRVKLDRRAAFFGVANPDDRATQLSAARLVQPLYENLQNPEPEGELKLEFDWQFDPFIAEGAKKERLRRLLGGDQTPAFLFTASHGMEFPMGDERQIPDQGALLCQDWPGPNAHRGRIPEGFYFAGGDLASDANVLGLIALFFACYGAGTPQLDQFAKQAFKEREQIAREGFIADLPKRLLRQGALAIVGHVERAWGYSFVLPSGDLDNQAFVTTLRKLLNGDPVGLATDPSFNLRYADKSSELSATLEELEWDEDYMDDYELAQMWTANNDARSYVVIGDPAVRIPFAKSDEGPTGRPSLDTKPDLKGYLKRLDKK